MAGGVSNMRRVEALAKSQGDPAHEYCHVGDNRVEGPGRSEWLVLTDKEADSAARDYIAESLWAFNASFLAGQTGLPALVFERLQGMCEASNDAVRAMIDQTCGLDEFVSEAISADGRGHFLAQYDGEEHELAHNLYAYRTN